MSFRCTTSTDWMDDLFPSACAIACSRVAASCRTPVTPGAMTGGTNVSERAEPELPAKPVPMPAPADAAATKATAQTSAMRLRIRGGFNRMSVLRAEAGVVGRLIPHAELEGFRAPFHAVDAVPIAEMD